VRQAKQISGPLLDRIDIHIEVPAVKVEKLTEEDNQEVESSQQIRNRVQKARDRQVNRYTKTALTSNAELTNKTIKEFCQLSEDCISLLKLAVVKMNLSGRAYYRSIKVARTIADLDDAETIQPNHLAEALQYRPKNNQL
jgi:magnesium chelatase family protein